MSAVLHLRGVTPGAYSVSQTMQRLIGMQSDTIANHSTYYRRLLGLTLERMGWQGDARQLADALPVTDRFDQSDFENCLAYLGYRLDRQRVTIDQLGVDTGPFLLLSPGESPMLVVELSGRGMLAVQPGWDVPRLHTPLAGSVTILTIRRLESSLSGAAEYARSKTGFTWFRGVLQRFSRLLWQVMAMGFLINIVALITPVFVMVVYDRVIGTRSLETLPYLAVGILLAIVLEMALRFLRVQALSWFSARINAVVSLAIFERLMFLPAALTEKVSVPSQLSRLRAFEMVRDFFNSGVFIAVLELPFIFVVMTVIGFIAGSLVWVGIVVTLLYGVMLAVMRKHILFNIHRSSRSLSERQQAAIEILTRLSFLRLDGVAERVMERYRQTSSVAAAAQFRSQFIGAMIEHASQALSLLAGVATLAFGVHLIWQGDLSIGGLVATMILTWRVLTPLQTACAMLPRLEYVRNGIDQVNRLMEMQVEREPYQPAQPVQAFRGKIEFAGVGLRYSRVSNPVFLNLTATIEAGQLVAIVGDNGVGKSTLLKMVAGLYAAQAGTIRIDGTDLRQFDPLMLRRNISYVPQQPAPLPGRLSQNLRLTAPLASDAELRQALGYADLLSEVDALPLGMETDLATSDRVLSAESLARLEMARLYLAPQSLILCDELPNALVNSTTGRKLLQFFTAQSGKRTVLCVTAHQDFLAAAHRVILLKQDSVPRLYTPQQYQRYLTEELS